MKNAFPVVDLSAAVPLNGQPTGLQLLFAEMQALIQVLPGSNPNKGRQPQNTEAMIEADFDNMPV
jgi:hypothetical protein